MQDAVSRLPNWSLSLIERLRDLLADLEKSSIGPGTTDSQSEWFVEKNGHLTHSDFVRGSQIWKY